MGNKISRRQLLRTGALLAGGLPIAGGLLGKAQASPIYAPDTGMSSIRTEREIALNAPADLKARLFANENPFGPSDKAKKAIIDAMPKSYQYPFMYLKDLYQKIADYEGVTPDNILMAAGSSPLLQAAAICFSIRRA